MVQLFWEFLTPTPGALGEVGSCRGAASGVGDGAGPSLAGFLFLGLQGSPRTLSLPRDHRHHPQRPPFPCSSRGDSTVTGLTAHTHSPWGPSSSPAQISPPSPPGHPCLLPDGPQDLAAAHPDPTSVLSLLGLPKANVGHLFPLCPGASMAITRGLVCPSSLPSWHCCVLHSINNPQCMWSPVLSKPDAPGGPG